MQINAPLAARLFRRASRFALCVQRRCPKWATAKTLIYNSEGYADPTAYGALKPIIQADAALEGKVNFLIKVLKFIANEAGFDVVNRIELRDRNTGRCFK